MPRAPKKPKRGEPHRMHVLLSAEMVDLIDRFAEELGTERSPETGLLGSDRTRSEAVRILIFEGLKARGLIK